MKVLIISHLPMATQNNVGKTFLSLFSSFDREELCQLYIYPCYPDVDRCASFYRVTDKDVLRSMLVKKPGGEVDRSRIQETAGLYERPEDESFYRNRKNKSALRRLLRDLMWSMSRWNNDQLKDWLDREKPECIFVAPGQAAFVYNFALKIAGDRKLPIVSYICDEYYFVKEPEQRLDKLRLRHLRNKIRELVEASSSLAMISEELCQAYTEEFATKVDVFMTGTSYAIAKHPRLTEHPTVISYFGNIRCNRYISLGEVGRELDCINQEQGTDYKLKIYTSEKDPEILETFSDIHAVELCGFLTGEAFQKAFQQAELLLHVEAFDAESVDFVKHSISTKIADSLASGIPLLAYGPESISSMQHLLRNDCASTAVSRLQLRDMLLSAFSDKKEMERVVYNARKVAEKYHDSHATSLRLRECIGTIIEKKAD